MAVRKHDPERQKRIDDQAEQIAKRIGVDPEKVMTDGNYGVVLTPDQYDKLFLALVDQGWKNAAATMREEAERRNASGPDHSLDLWAIYLAGATFLEEQIKAAGDLAARWAKLDEKCECRCNEGRHCGGCGHEGCGYTS